LDWRSALGSLATIRHLPAHSFHAPIGSPFCAACGEVSSALSVDISILNFERLKWGGVRHLQPLYAMLDLRWFEVLEKPQVTDRDFEILASALDRIARLGSTARPSDLEASLRGLFPSNAWERRTAIQILGYAGILIPRNRPTFWGEYPLGTEREGPRNTNDWSYPVRWWTGADGINRDAVAFWFPALSY
jgi:hypothetical protein